MNFGNVKQIKSIEFSIFGNKEIRNISVFGKDSVGITTNELYENLEPKKGGLIDPRMGTTGENILCETCGYDSNNCPGHFGHIDLEEYMFHIGFLPFVKKILSCVCLRCSKLLVYKNENDLNEIIKNKSGKNRLLEIKNLVKEVTVCQRPNVGCGTPVSKLKLEHKKTDSTLKLIAEIKTDSSEDKTSPNKNVIVRELTPTDCFNIIKNISDEDCAILGFNPKFRPEDMIHKIFPVPPIPVRPSVRSDGSASMREDDLTKKLNEILKKNNILASSKEKLDSQAIGSHDLKASWLQCHIATYFDNETPLMCSTEQKGKSINSLSSRLKGKYGRFRSNLMGKRQDFSARTVITPDPSIDINQVGVPLTIAMNLTFPEIVTPYNIDMMKKLVSNGRDVYPGANFVIKKRNSSGERNLPFDLRFGKEKIELQYGDIVERHLTEKDIVLLNRQPTLHKHSMMGTYVQIIKDPAFSSFRVNVGVTAPFNADYDG